MHGLAESKWSKQRSGPQFFSTKVEPPTAPAETVLDSDSVPSSAQMTFSSPRATLREANESHPSPKLETSAGPPGSHPVPSSDQGAASTALTRASIVRPVQESIAAPRPSPSSSAAAAPRAPPKANGGNPWAAFAMAADPEGQAQDGRSYVGGRSYIVDKPAATSAARNHPSKPFPPPQNKTPKPQMNPPKPFSQPRNNAYQRLGPTSAGSGWSSSPSTSAGSGWSSSPSTSAGSGWSSSPSTSASQQSWSQSPQSQNNSSQRLGPTSTASGWSSISSTSANQKPWTQPPRSATRPLVENRWAGKPLATTAMFTDDFFSTAKPRTQAPSTTSLSSAVDRQQVHESGRTSRMDAGSDIPDDPLFLQYPIGDGCHVVVAMYVERTAEAAASRFPTMTRKRQESSWKQKSIDEVATIFKQALTEEKKDVTG
ncbi:hypothetical protein KVV02_001702 [Mortierella alpina]|uniref:Uncharacterized protein n=1 Tax=Mortierella alpina TaxID=64518 RepID=A0A9P8CX95_MORAP|nr:hypothetical protein KVV02_001702 [Mortierella alpina]